jgi:putative membrane-bound dehydrogenase-like protein
MTSSPSHRRLHRASHSPIWPPRLLLLALLAGTLSAFGAAAAAPARIVFLAGARSHGPGQHEHRAGSLLLAKALNQESGLPVRAEVISGWPTDDSVLDGAAAIVIYDTATRMIGAHWERMDALAKKGVGLMFLHYAVHPKADMGEKYYRPWIGGAFESDFSVNPFWIADLTPKPGHPIAHGIRGPVHVHDEFYYNIRFRADRDQVLDLITATPSRENMVRVNNLWTQEGHDGVGQRQTLMWGTQRADGGRGVGFSGGHFHRNWAIDGFRQLVLNAIVWVAGVNVPAGGVVSTPLTEDELNANLDDKGRAGPRLTLPQPEEFAALKRGAIPTVAEHHALSAKPAKEKNVPSSPRPDPALEPAITKPAQVKSARLPPTPPVKATASLPKKTLSIPVSASALKVPDDLEVTIWAASPQFYNPTNMDMDSAGRIWVAEGVNYRKKKDRRPSGDRIVVLEDRDGDGRADASHVFVEDPELISPLGISVIGNKVIVAQPPHLIVYTDVDGDLRFDPKKDKRENLLTGFLGANHDHSLHSVVGGPDGRWYFNQGNTGAEFTTRDGVTYRVGGPYASGEPLIGARSDDGRIWTGGFAASMNPDGTKLRIIGHGFRNSYEQCVTSFGDVYQNDNDDPPACRTTWLMEGGFMGFFSRSGKRTWEADRRRGQSIPVAQWRQEDPGTLPPGDIYGRGAPTGIAFYENGALPEKYRGMLLSAESRLQTIFGYYPAAAGAGMKLERFEFLKAAEGSYFRPSDVMVGADGAIYVSDWFDERVGGHGTQDDSLAGAIYRIAPKGFRPQIDSPKRAAGSPLSTQSAVALLRSPAPNVRFEGLAALQELARKDPIAATQAIQPLLADPNPYLRARAIWLLPLLGQAGQAEAIQRLEDPVPQNRILALRSLRNVGFDFLAHAPLLGKLVTDTDAAVRRELAVLLREQPAEAKRPWIEELFARYDGKDRTYLEACGLAAEGIEEKIWGSLQTRLTQRGPLTWSETFARITWRLQPPAAMPALMQRAQAKSLSFEERKLAVDTIAFTRTASAVQSMVQLRRAEPAIAELATAWLLIRATDEWETFGGRKVLKDEGIYDPDTVVIQEARMPEQNPENRTTSVAQVLKLSGDATRGKNVSARCVMCHRLEGLGVDYGPDLQGWVANQGVEAFLKAVITPSESIALGFEGVRVPLKDGREVQGIVLSAADPLTVRSMGGITQMIPRAMLNKRTVPMRRSLMLSAAEMGLTEQDLADLAAYMKGYR